MGLKEIKELIELQKNANKTLSVLTHEVALMRKEFSEHVKMQQGIVKEWMQKDLDHHYKDNKVALSAIELLSSKRDEIKNQ